MKRLSFLFFLGTAMLTVNAVAAGDEKPQLMSRTGGGASNTWESPAALQKDAEAGKPAALAAFGEMLLSGDQVTKDVPRGISMLERAAKEGQASAAFRLGKVYDDGELTQRDAPKALDYYRQAALAGVSEAQYNLGTLYINARGGVKRDLKEGLAWLIVATKHGADGEGEKQIRDRLKNGSRAQIIPAAEARAAEIEAQLAQNPTPPAPASPSTPAAKK